jgi:outer membrane protein
MEMHRRSKAICIGRALIVLMTAWAAGGGLRAQQPPQAERLTLKQALAQAVERSREVGLARLRYEAARREAGLSRSQFWPNVYAGSGAAYTSGFPLAAGGGAPALVSVAYNQALFDTQARGEARATEQRVEQQRLAVDAARDAVIVRVASAYLELAKIRRSLEFMARERESAEKILAYVRQRMEAGLELPVEVTRAQLTAARVAQRIAQFENRDDTLAEQLRNDIGLPPGQPVEVASEEVPAAGQPVGDLVGQALANSIELKQAASEREAMAARLRGERGSYWPTLAVTAQYNVLAKFNNYDQFFNKFQRNNVIAGVEIRIPLFASRTSSGVAAAQANLAAADMAVENTRSGISLDVHHKTGQTREADMAREVARLELELAQQNLQVLQSQFNEGRTSLRDLEVAQLDQNDKWLAFLDADFARQQAQLELLRATGQVALLAQ